MLASMILALTGVLPLAAPAVPTPTPPATTCNTPPTTTDLVNPPEIKSQNGVLAVTLHLRGSPDPTNIEALCWFWNDGGQQTWVPPTLHVKQGDEIRLTLVNELIRTPGNSKKGSNGGGGGKGKAGEEDLGGWSDSHTRDPYALMCGQTQAVPTPTPDPVTGRIYGYHRPAWNETNMHFHGLNVSPKQPSDDVVNVILCPRLSYGEPARSYTYVIDIPRNEPAGLYWFHPHPHGESERQVLSQLTGAIIIDPVTAAFPQTLPSRVIMVRDVGAPGSIRPELNPALRPIRALNPSLAQIRADFKKYGPPNPDLPPYRFGPPQACPGSLGRLPHNNTKQLIVNNVPLPLFPNHEAQLPRGTMTVGQTEYWRLANTAADTILDLELFQNGQRVPINVVERDGVPLVVNNGRPTYQAVPMSHVQLSPAARLEFYVRASAPGKIVLRTKAIDSGCLGDLAFERDLLIVQAKNSHHAPPAVRIPTAVDPVPMRFADLARQNPVKHRYFVFTEYNRDDEPIPDWYITEISNPKAVEHPFAPHGPPDVTVHAGTVEDWTILNYTQELHEFHMHQIHFLVMKDHEGIEYGQNQLLDMVEVKYGGFRGTSQNFVPGQVTVRMDFRDPTIVGEFVYHCHILSHEDNGMMAKIRVLPPKGSSQTAQRPQRPKLPDVALLHAGDRVDLNGLVDQDGKPFPGPDARGKVLVSSFTFTRCPDGFACPLTAGKFAYLQAHLDAQREHLVLFSLDPAHDTPAVLRAYGKLMGQDPKRWSFVTGNPATLRALASKLGEPRSGDLLQPDALAVLDSSGQLRSTQRDDWQPDTALAAAQTAQSGPTDAMAVAWASILRMLLMIPLMLFAW